MTRSEQKYVARSNLTLALTATIVVALVLVAMAELVVRVITYTNPETGILMIGRFAMLPYRPKAEFARAALAKEKHVGDSTYFVLDPELGWTIKANGEGGKYTATAQGFRGPKGWSTTRQIPKGIVRICIYGDSFTHGDGVVFKDTWGDQLQHLRQDLQVLNFGVPAYGTDQAFLRFRRDGRKFDAQFHILGIWPEDLVRDLSVIRFYLNPQGGVGTSKPRFILNSGKLALLNSPVMSDQMFLDTVLQKHVAPVEAHDYWYREREQRFPFYYHLQSVRAALSVYNAYRRREIRNREYFDENSEAIQLAVAISEEFKKEVNALGSHAFVAIIPMRDFLDAEGAGGFPLVQALKRRSIDVLDFGPAFASEAKRVGADKLYLPDGHLSAAGNRLLAKEMNAKLSPAIDSVLVSQ